MPVSEKVLHRLINLGNKRKALKQKKLEQQKQKEALLLEYQNNSNWPSLTSSSTNEDGSPVKEEVQVIHKLYCRECQMEEEKRKRDKLRQVCREAGLEDPQLAVPSPPPCTLEEMSIQGDMDKNKEALKKKLMLRRPLNDLVDRGIYPPLKTPPAFAEQRRQLERAKTGDLLRHKIQSRPNRQLLVDQNILQDSTAHPAIQEKQKQLKRARLVDGLNDRISQRPGPLELVEDNILQSNELHEALIEGKLHYNRTCEGEDPDRPVHFIFDEESVSDGVPSPQQTALESDFSQLGSVQSTSALSPVSDVSQASFQATTSPVSQYVCSSLASSSRGTSIPVPPPAPPLPLVPGQRVSPIILPGRDSFVGHMTTLPSPTNSISSVSSTSSTSSRSGSSKPGVQRIKKVRQRAPSKNKVIKFHEYKGPPNVVKTQQPVAEPDTTPYHILLQQQQMFLEWQRELQKGNMLPTNSTCSNSIDTSTLVTSNELSPISSSTPSPPKTITPTPVVSSSAQPPQLPTSTTPSIKRQTTILDEMKVADLKLELKKRNLTVSGPKPQLIERLKPYIAEIAMSRSPAQQTHCTSPQHSSSGQSRLPLDTSPQHSVSSVKSVLALTPPTPKNEDTNFGFTVISPPVSPESDLNSSSISVPMSPDTMDVSIAFPMQAPSPPQEKMEASRPPSAVPMDVDSTQNPEPIYTNVTLDLNNLTQLNGLLNNDTATVQFSPPHVVTSQPALITNDELVKIQQRQIEELQRQLKVSQIQLQLQQQTPQSQANPQQQQHSPKTQTVNIIPSGTVLSQALLQQALLQQNHTSQPLIIQTSVPLQQRATTSLPASTVVTKPIPTTAVQARLVPDGAIQIRPGAQAKLVPVTALPQSFIITSGGVKPRSNTAPINGTTTILKSPSSLPASPSKSLPNSGGQFFSASLPASDATTKYNVIRQTNRQRKQPVLQVKQPQLQPQVSQALVASQALAVSQALAANSLAASQAANTSMVSSRTQLTARTVAAPKAQNMAVSRQQHNAVMTTMAQQRPTMTYADPHQHQHSPFTTNDVNQNTAVHQTKCQAMDDVLDILIKCGELPPSAAEAPFTSRRISQPTMSPHPIHNVTAPGQHHPFGGRCPSPGKPAPIHINPSINAASPDLTRLINEQFANDDLNSIMDWPESMDLDLAQSPRPTTSIHGSDTSLMTLGMDQDQTNMNNIDISDWLDVIMPNASNANSMTPLSANFPSDPILTPKPEDVLDLFNMKETDFNAPSDMTSTMNWERLAELTKS